VNALVHSAGFLTSVQDLGRIRFRKSGVSVGGALDMHALRVANALVGNDDNAAGLEATLGKLQLRFEDERLVAWCGGPFTVRIGGEDLPAGHAGLVTKAAELTMTAPHAGARAWLAISGGIELPLVLGSRATDLRGNFGGMQGRALRNGDSLPLARTGGASERRPRPHRGKGDGKTAPWISDWSAPTPWASIARRDRFLRIVKGAQWDSFRPDAQTALVTTTFTVTPNSDRMGARLDGPNLDRTDAGDLLSEPVSPGTLQVPPNGKPILLLGDCQTIGGYPKIAHVITVDMPIAAQLWAGETVRFQEVPLTEAHSLFREREEDFSRFRIGLGLHQP
jgi:antagonist of KipI